MKFKVWDTEWKKWLPECDYFMGSDGSLYCFGKSKQLFKYEPAIIVFSTGKTDKNGVDWWQGDLFYSTTNCLVEIVWSETGWGTEYLTGGGKGAILVAYDSLLSCMEKIGNKFENPELLKESC